ncbi:MAG: DUF3109 family protein [Bacteroidota bacterium]
MSDKPMVEIQGYSVAPELFEKGYAQGMGPCTCTSTCCSGGVYADIKERDSIIAHKELIKKYMDETQPKDEALWFDESDFEDKDFPSQRAIGTTVHNDKCAFLDKQGRCSIQLATTTEGTGRWALKPLFCILFPIEISNKVIGFDDLLQGDAACCSIGDEFQTPLFEACKDELVHLLGDDGFRTMQEHYAQIKPAVGAQANVRVA